MNIISKGGVRVPKRYVPKHLSKKDKKKQAKELKKSRRAYKRGKYYQRKKVKSFSCHEFIDCIFDIDHECWCVGVGLFYPTSNTSKTIIRIMPN